MRKKPRFDERSVNPQGVLVTMLRLLCLCLPVPPGCLQEQRLLFYRVHTALKGLWPSLLSCTSCLCTAPLDFFFSQKVAPMLMMLSYPRRVCLDSQNTLHLIYNSPLSGIMYNLDIIMQETHKDGFAEIKSLFPT